MNNDQVTESADLMRKLAIYLDRFDASLEVKAAALAGLAEVTKQMLGNQTTAAMMLHHMRRGGK